MKTSTNPQRVPRLLTLAQFLESDVYQRIDGAKFDLGRWGTTAEREVHTDEGITYELNPVPRDINRTSECGFAGCAVGWGYYCKPLVKAGIRKLVGPYGDGDELEILQTGAAFGRVAEFFGIDEDDAVLCFQARSYMPAEQAKNYFIYSTAKIVGRAGIQLVVKRLRLVAASYGVFEKLGAEVAP